MEKMTYNLYSLGCKVNSYDSNKLAKQFEAKGIMRSKTNADFAVIHTCSVTGAAIVKNKQMIKKARKENPKAKIVLAGCWPRVGELDHPGLEIDFVIKDEKLDDFWKFVNVRHSNEVIARYALSEISKARYFIKVQDGCEQFCSYCIIPYARGPLRSREKAEILDELKEAIAKGYQEIVISGIHLGLYGHGSDYKLPALLKDILALDGLGRIRLSSIEINEVNDAIIELMKNNPKFCKHLHIPLQSGCDKILKSMNRPYDTFGFENKIKKIRQAIPEISISTDVIVGFPGETDDDFAITRGYIEKIAFSRLHVFSFSAHEKTPAYSMPDQINRGKINERAKDLRGLSDKLEKIYEQKFKGKKLTVVLENFKKGRAKMKTEYYFDIDCPIENFKHDEVGQLKEVIFD